MSCINEFMVSHKTYVDIKLVCTDQLAMLPWRQTLGTKINVADYIVPSRSHAEQLLNLLPPSQK